MSSPFTQNETDSVQKKWIVVLYLVLLLLAIFWSVDASVFYVLLGASVFSFFRAWQFRSKLVSQNTVEEDEPIQSRSFEQPKTESFLNSLSPQQKKAALVYGIGFIGFIFFFILVGSLIDFINSSVVSIMEYQQKASDYYYIQQYDSSAYYYRLAIENDPENADLWFERGNAFLNSSNTDSALFMYRKAVDLKPDFEQAQYNIGYILFERKNYREAAEETSKILEYNPEYVDASLLIGDSFYNQSQFDSALTHYERAYETGYRSAVLCHLMAYINDTKGNTTDAIALYREAIGQDSTIADIYVRLGELVSGEEGEWFRKKAMYWDAQRTQ